MIEFITSASITATLLQDYNLSNYVNRTNEYISYLAETYGLSGSDITLPIHSQLNELAVAYCSKLICMDKLGTNGIEVSTNDKYFLLYNMYNDIYEKLLKYITPELMKKTATDPAEYSPTVTIFRG